MKYICTEGSGGGREESEKGRKEGIKNLNDGQAKNTTKQMKHSGPSCS